jgi:murein DD-endopeptidase
MVPEREVNMSKSRLLFMVALLAASLPSVADDLYVRQDALGLEVRVPEPPSWVAARDGRHALYELSIANLRRHELRLEKIEVIDATNDQILLTLSGEALRQATARRGWDGPEAETTLWRGGQHGTVFVELLADAGAASLPTQLRHRLYATSPAPATGSGAAQKRWVLETQTVPFGPAPLRLSAPLKGPGWLAGNALSNESDHRRSIIPVNGRAGIAQRYAIDWVRIGPHGRPAKTESGANAEYFGYQEPVLAVASGRIAAVKDGIAENVPRSTEMAVPMTLETVAGNYVLLELQGAYVLYAHLEPGTIRVHPGETVDRGQVIGLLGNSGQSDAPHLHLHVTDRPASLAGEGRPYVFETFRYRGSVGNLDQWWDSGEPWQPEADTWRTLELPLDGDVVDFPP